MSNVVIHVEHLGKQYKIGQQQKNRTLRDALVDKIATSSQRLLRNGQENSTTNLIWALRDVAFEVRQGEVLGIIGRNGAGKSTLLKILSRITKPTHGLVKIRGRVGSLLEIGTGFHPELTGRENIYLNGAVLGMKKVEIDRKFDEIVAFAEVERFMETPVKRYSSGMYMRLAFAVAAHLEPEILIVDEVLAVGDAMFQKKCLNKMEDAAGEGRTVLFVSHNMGVVQTLCQSVLLLEQGQIRSVGPAKDVVADYLKNSDVLSSMRISERNDRRGLGQFRFENLTTLDGHGQPCEFAVTGEDLYFHLRLTTSGDRTTLSAPLDVAILIRDYQGQLVTTLASFFTASSPTTIDDSCEIFCFVPHLPLLAGRYRLDLWCATSGEEQDLIMDAAVLQVEPGNYFANTQDIRLPRADYHGACMIPQRWSNSRGERK